MPGERLVMSTAQGPFPMETTYTWDDAGQGATRMTLRNRGEPSGVKKVAVPVIARAMRRAMTKDLRRLSEILQGPGSGRDEVTATDWTFAGTWPFEPRWFDTVDGRMHYVDEGPRDGRPVVLLHGNPTWGYLYRNFIGPLTTAGHRAIVPDHLGFGRSDTPDRPDLYTIRRHADRLEALLESLGLRDAVVVPQDWGGPIGLYWAGRHPERIAGLFLLNTFAHRPPDKVPLPLPLRVFRLPVAGEVAVKGLDLFKRVFLFRVGVVHRERLDATVRAAYRAPHPTWGSRTPILVFPREIPAGPEGPVSDLLAEIEASLAAVADRPVAIVWAMRDIAFTPEVLERLWMRTFPHAQVTRLDDAGHYLQEDAHERIVPALLRFLDALATPSPR